MTIQQKIQRRSWLQIMTKERNAVRKPLSFSTTMRNPERIAGFLKCILPYEGQVLNNDVIHEVAINLIRDKYYYTQKYEMKVPEYRNIYNNEDLSFTREQAEDIIKNSPQEHKEAGFERGWPSRFDTWYEFPQELGFIRYEIGKPIIISQTGHMLVDAFNEEQPNNEKIQDVFLNALMKYQTNNPFKKNANSNCPLILTLQTIEKLKKCNKDSVGIHRQELSLIICWPDNDYNLLVNKILDLRKKYGFNISNEVIYEECMNLLGAGKDKENLYKMSKITGEAVDEFIRKMRITGIFSLRGNGRFLDTNNYEKEKIVYILENYTTYKTFSNKDEYFSYTAQIDSKILTSSNITISTTAEAKENALIKWSKVFSKEEVEKELVLVSKNSKTNNEILKVIDAPTRLEFLTSISLKQHFESAHIIPNYKIDDEGLPTFTAAGGIADIECFDDDCKPIVEVTLMTSRAQGSNEIPAITRHLKERQQKYISDKVFALFIAPAIHADAQYMIEFSKFRDNVDIIPYTILEYVAKIAQICNLQQLSV